MKYFPTPPGHNSPYFLVQHASCLKFPSVCCSPNFKSYIYCTYHSFVLFLFQLYVDQLLEHGRHGRFDSDDSDSKEESSADIPQIKHFYKFKLFPKKFVKVYFDRLALLALLDR